MLEVRVYRDGVSGRLYGKTQWNGIQLFFNNFRKHDDGMFADVSTPSSECYINARGQERWKNIICGLLCYGTDIAYLTLELSPEQKQEFFCVPVWKISETDSKKYILLNFHTKGI